MSNNIVLSADRFVLRVSGGLLVEIPRSFKGTPPPPPKKLSFLGGDVSVYTGPISEHTEVG